MLDILLNDEFEHRLEKEMEQKLEWAISADRGGHTYSANLWLEQAAELEKKLIVFRQEKLNRLIDWW